MNNEGIEILCRTKKKKPTGDLYMLYASRSAFP